MAKRFCDRCQNEIGKSSVDKDATITTKQSAGLSNFKFDYISTIPDKKYVVNFIR